LQYEIVTGGLLPPPQSDLQCVEIATGKIIWTKKKVGKYHASLVRTADNKILMLEDFGSLVMFEPNASGYKEICRAKVCGHTWAHPAVSEGRVFLRDEKELLCVDLNQSSK
jgi:outer membrane protein assembly factor BamB